MPSIAIALLATGVGLLCVASTGCGTSSTENGSDGGVAGDASLTGDAVDGGHSCTVWQGP